MDAGAFNIVKIVGGKAMFELEKKIIEWKTSLAASESYLQSDIDELEGHLREEMSKLDSEELSEQESFWIATQRLGTVKNLDREFRKVNLWFIWQKRMLWLLGGYLFFSILDISTVIFNDMYLLIVGEGFVKLPSFIFSEQYQISLDMFILTLILSILFLFFVGSKSWLFVKVRQQSIKIVRWIPFWCKLLFLIPTLFVLTFGEKIFFMILARKSIAEKVGIFAAHNFVFEILWSFVFILLFVVLFTVVNKRGRKVEITA
jgi:hypothetical protein